MKRYAFIIFLLLLSCDDSGYGDSSPHQCLGEDYDADNDGICDGDDDCVGEYDCEGICINLGSTSSSICYTYNDDILSILSKPEYGSPNGCLSCHGSSGGLDLSTYNSIIDGGDSGIGIIPDNPNESIVWQKINDLSMPPASSDGSNVSSSDRDIIYDWIMQGAVDE